MDQANPIITRKAAAPKYDADGAVPVSKLHVDGGNRGQTQSSSEASVAAQSVESGNSGNSGKIEAVVKKKKSRVAALRSRFSFKDLTKEAAAFAGSSDQTPSSSKDKSKSKDNDESEIDGSYDNDNLLGEYSPDDTSEAVLYTPTSGQSGACPQSAAKPPSGQVNSNKIYGPKKSGMSTEQEGMEEIDDADEQIDAMLREEIPAVRMGQYRNTGYGAVVKSQSSIQSMRAEKGSSTPETSFLADHGNEFNAGGPSGIERLLQKPRFPSAQDTSRKLFDITVPKMYSGKGRSFTDTTSHGGWAPSPPDINYQNTANLEQQFASHVQALHLHMDNVVGRLAKTFESSNSWAMDQILRNVESMTDSAKAMNARSMNLSGNIMGLQQGLLDVCDQIHVLRHEIQRSEEGLQAMVRRETNKLRQDINALVMSSSSSNSTSNSSRPSMAASKGLRVETQLPQGALETPGARNKYLRTKREQEASRTKDNPKPAGEKEVEVPERENKHAESKNSLVQQHRSGEQPPLPAPIPGCVDAEMTITEYLQRNASACNNPVLESSGSSGPQPANASLDAMSENRLPEKGKEKEKTTVDSSSHRTEEGVKTPHKKGSIFNFRKLRDNDGQSSSSSKFLRTPRRNKDGSKVATASTENLIKPANGSISTSPGTPPVPPVPVNVAQRAANPLGDNNMSPSAIHPALRTTRQRQVMQEREREQQRRSSRAHLQQQASARNLLGANSPHQAATVPSRLPTLRGSRSHQGFVGHRPSAATSPSVSLAAHLSPVADRSLVTDRGSSSSASHVPQVGDSPANGLQSLMPPEVYQDPASYVTDDWYHAYHGRLY